ncbi:MAG: hypothetical protein EOM25_09735 [Deltaproteobacteria bacterium]|nr:hypothetical protein [Deltaproteobacteria bacterium]
MPAKPIRVKIRTEQGQTKSLASGTGAFTTPTGAGPDLFLGLGPDPAAAALLTGPGPVRFVECPEFESQMDPKWRHMVPGDWKRIDPEDLDANLVGTSTVRIFRQNASLFPSFWGPILARTTLWAAGIGPRQGGAKRVLFAHGPGALMVLEISRAFSRAGFEVRSLAENVGPEDLVLALRDGCPDLFFSLNFQGLDRFGLNLHLLREAGVVPVTWCVDNPFHLLSGLETAFWRDMIVLTTDAWAVDLLRNLGTRAHFLPLAADSDVFVCQDLDRPPVWDSVFVGRSAFPNRDRFFSGLDVPKALLPEAKALMASGGRPDFSWWLERLGPQSLWPGREVRRAGLGAEICSLGWRSAVLEAVAGAVGLKVVGDEGWKELLGSEVTILPPVDYYHGLRDIYRLSAVTLTTTSLLLPGALTQRHFDVWVAGGCLLTDRIPGLDLFPRHLTDPVSFSTPDEAASLARKLVRDPRRRGEITAAWRETILYGHTYDHRVATILELASEI